MRYTPGLLEKGATAGADSESGLKIVNLSRSLSLPQGKRFAGVELEITMKYDAAAAATKYASDLIRNISVGKTYVQGAAFDIAAQIGRYALKAPGSAPARVGYNPKLTALNTDYYAKILIPFSTDEDGIEVKVSSNSAGSVLNATSMEYTLEAIPYYTTDDGDLFIFDCREQENLSKFQGIRKGRDWFYGASAELSTLIDTISPEDLTAQQLQSLENSYADEMLGTVAGSLEVDSVAALSDGSALYIAHQALASEELQVINTSGASTLTIAEFSDA